MKDNINLHNFLNDESITNNPIINYLFSNISHINGIGEKTYPKICKLINGNKIIDLLYHFPASIINRSYKPNIADAEIGKIATITVEVEKHIPSHNRIAPHKIIASDETDTMVINFFNYNPKILQSWFKVGDKKVISGKIEIWNGQISMTNPDYIVPLNMAHKIPNFEAIYPLTNGISNNAIKKIIYQVIRGLKTLIQTDEKAIPEWLDPQFKKQQNLPNWFEAIMIMHNPEKPDKIIARKRLSYDEILSSQLSLGIIRSKEQIQSGNKIIGTGLYKNQLLKNLNFELTNAQKSVLEDIYSDMASEKRMLRLIQGDVGSGKTIVAILAMLNAVECGYTAVLMAPTEILATQHFTDIQSILSKTGIDKDIKVELLTGKDNITKKKKKLQEIESEQFNIIIGTHALFQSNVKIPKLGLVVIDEQHRFGVDQRLKLSEKGINPDMLSMTATPIPRTLAMTLYGDMDISKIDEMPKNRIPIKTEVIMPNDFSKVIDLMKEKLSLKEKIYWVCPLVEQSMKRDLIAVESRYRDLQKTFGDKVEIVHGKMKAEEKELRMKRFTDENGTANILIATTVIEVGVNVPSATLMIIEHCETFGLSALHQLRGRVGRSNKPSKCILIPGEKITDVAKERIKVMTETTDGFVIAETDLKLRGSGEILGVKQSGITNFKIADYEKDKELFEIARKDVKYILNKDENLTSDRGKGLKLLLNLFNKTSDMEKIFSG